MREAALRQEAEQAAALRRQEQEAQQQAAQKQQQSPPPNLDPVNSLNQSMQNMSVNTTQSPQQPGPMQQLNVTLPSNIKPGETFQIRTPQGALVNVECPIGKYVTVALHYLSFPFFFVTRELNLNDNTIDTEDNK